MPPSSQPRDSPASGSGHPLLEPRTVALGMLYLLGYSVALTLAHGQGDPVFAEVVKIGGIVTPALFGGARVVQQLTRKAEATEAEMVAQTPKIDRIDAAVNGRMDRRFALLEMHVLAHGEDIATIKRDVAEVKAMLDDRLLDPGDHHGAE